MGTWGPRALTNWQPILQVSRTRTSAEPSSERNVLDGILIETTGLADPGDVFGRKEGVFRRKVGVAGDDGFLWSYTTVDGWNPAPPWMYNAL